MVENCIKNSNLDEIKNLYVSLDATYEDERWSTIGVSYNIIEVNYAVMDSYELFLLRKGAKAVAKQTSIATKQVRKY